MSSLYTVSQLKAALTGGGAKVDKFTIEMGTPAGDGSLTLGVDGPILCKSTSFPEKTIGLSSAFIQGRELRLPGDSVYPTEHEITFYNTADHAIRNMFKKWMSSIDNFGTNFHTCNPEQFVVEIKIHQLDCNGEPVATATLHNAWPSALTQVEVDSETINQIEMFTVRFTYSHWD